MASLFPYLSCLFGEVSAQPKVAGLLSYSTALPRVFHLVGHILTKTLYLSSWILPGCIIAIPTGYTTTTQSVAGLIEPPHTCPFGQNAKRASAENRHRFLSRLSQSVPGTQSLSLAGYVVFNVLVNPGIFYPTLVSIQLQTKDRPVVAL